MATTFASLQRRTNHEVGESRSRLVDLIIVLVRTSEGYSSEELARQLGVRRRTIQRYLQVLQHSSLDLTRRVDPLNVGASVKYSARI